jgi:transcription elongation GreA/GreB family factor
VFAGATIEFVTNDKGEVPYFIVHVVEGDFKAPRVDGPKPQ